jgi:hypothetical protein
MSISLLRCTDFDIVQILHLSAIDIQDKPLHCPRRTLRPTDRNSKSRGIHNACMALCMLKKLTIPLTILLTLVHPLKSAAPLS